MKHTMEHDEIWWNISGNTFKLFFGSSNWPFFSRFQNFGRSPKWFFLKKTKSRRSPVSRDEGFFLCVFWHESSWKFRFKLHWHGHQWSCGSTGMYWEVVAPHRIIPYPFFPLVAGSMAHLLVTSCFSALPLPISKFLPKLPAHLETIQRSRYRLWHKKRCFGGMKKDRLRMHFDLDVSYRFTAASKL